MPNGLNSCRSWENGKGYWETRNGRVVGSYMARKKMVNPHLPLILPMTFPRLNRCYISAEEGTGSSYTKAVNRVGIQDTNRNFHSWPFVSIDDLREEIKNNRKCEKIIFIDNLTVYTDLKKDDIITLLQDFPKVLFVFLAHEDERGEPLGAPATIAKQMAYAYFHVKGKAAYATVRGGKNERIDIDEETASLIHGDKTDFSRQTLQNSEI